MAKSNLEQMIAWANPSKNPVYILLARSDYRTAQSDWKLPVID